MAIIRAIVSVTDDWGIGCKGSLLVSNPEDMARFVALTTGHTVLMGRKTLDSFPGGRPLKNRRNIVLTRNPTYKQDGFETVCGIKAALEALGPDEEVWVIGGESVYRAMLRHCREVLVTRNHMIPPAADAWFPDISQLPSWKLGSVEPGGVTKEGVAFDYETYVPAEPTPEE